MTDGKRKDGVAAKLLMPVVATVASGLASYLAKKGPQLIEETLLPKLRETKQSTGDVANDLVDRVRTVAPDVHDDDTSNDDLERRRRERAEHRASRRKAS